MAKTCIHFSTHFFQTWFSIFNGESQLDSLVICFVPRIIHLLSIYLRPRPTSAYGGCIGRAHRAHTALAVVCMCSFIKVPNYTEIWNISWQSRRKMATVIHNPLKSWVFHSFTFYNFLLQWNVTVRAPLTGTSTGISARIQWIQYFPNPIYCNGFQYPFSLHMPPSCRDIKNNSLFGGKTRPCTFCMHASARFAGTQSCRWAHSAPEYAFDRSLRARVFVSARRDNLHEPSPMQLMPSRLWTFVCVWRMDAHAIRTRQWYLMVSDEH